MLQVGAGLAYFRLGAGEPLLLEFAFEDRRGARQSLTGSAFAASVYDDLRAVEAQIAGVLLADEGGDFVRFADDGTLSERLYGKVGLHLEIAEAYRAGRSVIASGALTIAATAGSMPSLGDDGAIGGTATRVTVRQRLLRAPVLRVDVVPFVPVPIAPSLTTTLSGSTLPGSAVPGFVAAAQAIADHLHARGGPMLTINPTDTIATSLAKLAAIANATSQPAPASIFNTSSAGVGPSGPVLTAGAISGLMEAAGVIAAEIVVLNGPTVVLAASQAPAAILAALATGLGAFGAPFAVTGTDPIDVTLEAMLDALAGATAIPPPVALTALTLSATSLTVGTAATLTIRGATPGSTINGTPPDGMTLYGRKITGKPTTAGSYELVLTETLAGATGNPKQTTIAVTVVAAASIGWPDTSSWNDASNWSDAA